MSLAQTFAHMGFVGFCVMGFLLALSIYSLAVIVDKYRRFRAASSESIVFLAEFGRCLEEGKLQDAVATARRHDRSHVARVVAAGVSELLNKRQSAPDAESQIALVSQALELQAALTLSEMRRGLGGLATVGSTAPFIGLFGTVVGIIHAFGAIAATGSGGIAVVSGGIAESLVATALGILVATPAVMAFNYFVGVLDRFQLEMSATSTRLVTFLNSRIAAHATS